MYEYLADILLTKAFFFLYSSMGEIFRVESKAIIVTVVVVEVAFYLHICRVYSDGYFINSGVKIAERLT